MIKSMTGYGKSQGEIQGRRFLVEIRSINSKTLDIGFKIPAEFREMEAGFRTRVSAVLSRGKVDCNVTWIKSEPDSEENLLHLNQTQIRTYLEELQRMGYRIAAPGIGTVLALPGTVCENRSLELQDSDRDAVLRALDESLHATDESRTQEGSVLEKDFLLRVTTIEELAQAVEPFERERVPAIRQRLEKQLSDWENAEKKVDANRLEQEMIYYLEKLDITEEKVRLHKHCRYFLDTMREDMPGRKLAFIAQEMGREINTMGSKANHVDIQKLVVQMKDELEKIKEQLFNIL